MSTQDTEPIQQTVKKFLTEELSYGLADGCGPDTDLIEQGVIDSMSLLRLVTFLEERYQLRVKDEDLVPENFRTLAAIDTFIQEHRKPIKSYRLK